MLRTECTLHIFICVYTWCISLSLYIYIYIMYVILLTRFRSGCASRGQVRGQLRPPATRNSTRSPNSRYIMLISQRAHWIEPEAVSIHTPRCGTQSINCVYLYVYVPCMRGVHVCAMCVVCTQHAISTRGCTCVLPWPQARAAARARGSGPTECALSEGVPCAVSVCYYYLLLLTYYQ